MPDGEGEADSLPVVGTIMEGLASTSSFEEPEASSFDGGGVADGDGDVDDQVESSSEARKLEKDPRKIARKYEF